MLNHQNTEIFAAIDIPEPQALQLITPVAERLENLDGYAHQGVPSVYAKLLSSLPASEVEQYFEHINDVHRLHGGAYNLRVIAALNKHAPSLSEEGVLMLMTDIIEKLADDRYYDKTDIAGCLQNLLERWFYLQEAQYFEFVQVVLVHKKRKIGDLACLSIARMAQYLSGCVPWSY